MSRSNRHEDSDDKQECWSLRMLRLLLKHAEVLGKIYENVRPLGRGLVKVAFFVSGFFAGLDVLEQAVTLLR